MTLAAVQGLSSGALMWIVAAFCLAAFSQALSGFGFALLCIPLLTVVCSRSDAVVAATMVGLVTQLWLAFRVRHEIDRPTVRRALPASLLGMPVGIVVGHLVSDRALRIAVGVAVLSAVVAISRGATVRGRPVIVDSTAGFVSGVLSTTTGTNGPPLVVALAGRSMPPGVTRATLTGLFLAANVVSLALFAADGRVSRRSTLIAAIGLVPSLTVRAATEPLFRRLDPLRYRNVVLTMLTLAGIVAIVNALH